MADAEAVPPPAAPDATSTPVHKDGWDKLSSIGSFLSATLISFLIGFLGHWYTYKVEDRKLDLEILKLAIDVLKTKPSESGGDDMRKWSLGVLETYSRVKFTGDSPVRNQVILSNIQGFVGTRIDIDIFVCDQNDAGLLQMANAYGNTLAGSYGRIRVKPWISHEFDANFLSGKTTIVYDDNPGEIEAYKNMERLASQVPALPPVQGIVNPGKPSLWYLSAIVCH